MSFRNKVFAGFAVTVLALTMMLGTAMASTKELPFEYPNEAGYQTNNDVWVKLIGGGAGEAVSTQEIADLTASVDIVITGKCSFDAELIHNYDGNWKITKKPSQTVDGELILNLPFHGKDTSYSEVVVNLQNKTEGPLAVTRLDWKDEAGKVVFTWPVAAEAPAESAAPAADVPKTGVLSAALFLAFGTAAFGTGAVVLKKKER